MSKLVNYIIGGLIIFLGLIVSTSLAQETNNLIEIENRIDKSFKYFSNDYPGAVVAVMKNGEVIFNKAYGLSNIQSQEKMLNDKLFNLGELSKSFTALAILQLVEKNKLSLDNNLKDIFQDFPEYGKDITISNILSHKSGLLSFDVDVVKTNNDVYDFLIKQPGISIEPGSGFNDCNSDYALLAKIIEKVSGMSYQNYIKKYILDKLSMDNTYFVDNIKDKNYAKSHFKYNDAYKVENRFNNIYGNQGIYTNTIDYAKFDQALYTNKLLKCESLMKIFKFEKLNEGENRSDYDYGWVLMAKNGIRYYWQGSSQEGYSNIVFHLPDTQTTVLILTNRNDAFNFLRMSIYIAKLFDKDLNL